MGSVLCIDNIYKGSRDTKRYDEVSIRLP